MCSGYRGLSRTFARGVELTVDPESQEVPNKCERRRSREAERLRPRARLSLPRVRVAVHGRPCPQHRRRGSLNVVA